MRVVDDDADRVGAAGDELEAAGNAFERCNSPLDRIGWNARGPSRRRRRRGCYRRSAGRREAIESSDGRTDSPRRTPTLRATTESRPRRTSARWSMPYVITRGFSRGQLGAARIVQIDDRRGAGRQHVEQTALGREVLLHVAVKIEMVAREIREDRGREPQVRDAMERERVRGHFDRARRAAAIDHLAKQPLRSRLPRASCGTRPARRRRPAPRGTSPCRGARHGMPAASKTEASR